MKLRASSLSLGNRKSSGSLVFFELKELVCPILKAPPPRGTSFRFLRIYISCYCHGILQISFHFV